jgi:hypothetical protein
MFALQNIFLDDAAGHATQKLGFSPMDHDSPEVEHAGEQAARGPGGKRA